MSEDFDMRIAGDHPSQELKARAAEEETGLVLAREKENGNLERARQLGAAIAGEVWAAQGETLFGADNAEDGKGIFERRLLFAFAVSSALESCTPNALCTRTALNSFFDVLKKDAPALYDDLEQSFAFSFYYRDLRAGKEVPEDIGRSFAMLCNREDDDNYAKLGEALYLRFVDVVKQRAASMHFVTDDTP